MLSSRSTKNLIVEKDTHALTRGAVALRIQMTQARAVALTKRRAFVRTQQKT